MDDWAWDQIRFCHRHDKNDDNKTTQFRKPRANNNNNSNTDGRSHHKTKVRTGSSLRTGRIRKGAIRYEFLSPWHYDVVHTSLRGSLNTYYPNLHSSGDSGRDLTNDDKLVFYGLYKQATIGKCNTQRPGMLDFVGKKKWDSWNALGDMSAEEVRIRLRCCTINVGPTI